MSFQTESLSSENHPILLAKNISHFHKIVIIRWGQYYKDYHNGLKRDSNFTSIKAYENVFIKVFNNNTIGHDELMILKDNTYNNTDCYAVSNATQFKNNVQIRNSGLPNIFDYQIPINDYCNFLEIQNKPNPMINFKIFEICQKLKIDINDPNNTLENLEKINQACEDLVGVQKI